MKLLFCVQRYGANVVGGGESLCRHVALRLASHHEVSIATSCATDYLTWANVLPSGTSTDEGCTVHRFPTRALRDISKFDALTRDLLAGSRTLAQQEAWMLAQGPDLPSMTEWLALHHDQYDVVVFFTAEYAHAYAGIPVVTRRPVILQPLAHDTPYLRLPISIQTLERVPYHVYNTPEERSLVTSVCERGPARFAIIAVGVEPVSSDPLPWPTDVLPNGTPYLLVVGRFDESKGSIELLRYFRQYVGENSQSPLHLVFAGPGSELGPPTARVRYLGTVEEARKAALFAHCIAHVVPSPYESLSMAALEGWMHQRPLIANSRCAVLSGQVYRSSGGVVYDSIDGFVEATQWVMNQPDERVRMGACGHAYVTANYMWSHITDKWITFLHECVQHWHEVH